jgi:hypothetical protein
MNGSNRDTSAAPSMGELVQDLARLVSTLIRGEIALAKLELRDAVSHTGAAFALFVVAAVLALSGYIFFLIALMLLLRPYVGAGWAAAIVTLLLFVSAGIAASLGHKKLMTQRITVSGETPAMPADSGTTEPTITPGGGTAQ